MIGKGRTQIWQAVGMVILLGILPATACRTSEVAMKKYSFDTEIVFRGVDNEEAARLFTTPSHLHVSVNQPVIGDDTIIAEAELVNEGGEFLLVVVGASPFDISLDSPDVVKYIGLLRTPCAPMPIALTVPAQSSVVFNDRISLDDYTWEGTPQVVLNWYFVYLKTPYPGGKLEIRLPKKIHRKTGPPIVIGP